MDAERTSPGRQEKVHVGQMAAIALVASLLGIALGLIIDWFPTAASTQAGKIDTLWDVLIICSVPIFVGVMTIVLYSVWRFRMRAGEEELDGPPIHGNTRLEIVWTAIPAILLVALCTYAYVVLTDIEEAKGSNELPVRVVGEQFTWTFHYKGSGGKEVVSNQLYVPLDRPVHFTVQSKDVIHDFWVPAFRMKIDAVRGIDTDLRVTPTRLGEYPVVCAELCGIGHSAMRQTAHVVSQQDFDKWLSDREKAAAGGGAAEQPAGGGGAAPDGKALFTSSGCGGCHKLADAGTAGGVGPDLDEGLKGKDDAFIKQSIVDPDAEVTSGFQPGIMPATFGQTLGPDEVDALVKYLAEVTG
jgi:cytochrome c oxidase subunit 2